MNYVCGIRTDVISGTPYQYEYRGYINEQVPEDTTNVTFHSTVTRIRHNAFEHCKSLTKVSIPKTIVKIGAYAFNGCISLKEVHFEDGSACRKICEGAFFACCSLQSIELPNGITTVFKEAFAGCVSLSTATLPHTVTALHSNIFVECVSLTNLKLPQNLQYVSMTVFDNSNSINEELKQIKLPPKVCNYPSCLWAGFCNAKHAEKLKEGSGPKFGFKGAVQKGYGPELCGITLKQIKDLLLHPKIDENSTMEEVVERVIKPITKDCGMSYALLVNRKKPLHARVMVSVSAISKMNFH